MKKYVDTKNKLKRNYNIIRSCIDHIYLVNILISILSIAQLCLFSKTFKSDNV